MIDAAIRTELLNEVAQLPPALQQRVVEYARTLAQARSRGTPGTELLRFAGTLDPEDARMMMEAVEEGCEQVGSDEW
ncbi:MAG TPA: hypothetical protein VMZ50_08960 [Phycisphaerae bacterium]|nr:hypothetical protein [Phycisphaerae bacterium]